MGFSGQHNFKTGATGRPRRNGEAAAQRLYAFFHAGQSHSGRRTGNSVAIIKQYQSQCFALHASIMRNAFLDRDVDGCSV